MHNQQIRNIAIGSLLAAVAVLLLVNFPGEMFNTQWFHHLSTLTHAALFGVIGWLILQRSELETSSITLRISAVVGFTLVSGSLIEGLQSVTGRSPSLADMTANLAGAGAVAIVVAPQGHPKWPRLRLPAYLVAATLLAPVLFEPGIYVWNAASIRHNFPTLSNLEGAYEQRRWSGGSVDSRIVREGKKALRFDLSPARYSGPTLTHFARDWRGYRALRISIFNSSSSALPLTLFILDREHRRLGSPYEDRYNTHFALAAGWNDLEIELSAIASAPRDREMDLSDISEIGVFTTALPAPSTMYIDAMVLVR